MTDEQATVENRSPVSFVDLKETLLWLLRLRIRRNVTGRSMEPTLGDGDQVFVRTCTTASVGDIVLCRHPYRADIELIKRVRSISDVGLMLFGDNPAFSTDSSSFGEVPWVHLIGTVTARVRKR